MFTSKGHILVHTSALFPMTQAKHNMFKMVSLLLLLLLPLSELYDMGSSSSPPGHLGL